MYNAEGLDVSLQQRIIPADFSSDHCCSDAVTVREDHGGYFSGRSCDRVRNESTKLQGQNLLSLMS